MDTFETAHKLIAISNNGKTVTSKGGRVGGWYGNAFGRIAIEAGGKNKYEWKLTCKQRRGGYMWIGIQSNRNVNAEWDFGKIDYGYNGFYGNKCHLGKYEDYGIKWGAGDVIEMRVDFEKREMGYSVNGSDQGIAFRNLRLGKTYYLVVSVSTDKGGDSLVLSDIQYENKEEEKKEEFGPTYERFTKTKRVYKAGGKTVEVAVGEIAGVISKGIGAFASGGALLPVLATQLIGAVVNVSWSKSNKYEDIVEHFYIKKNNTYLFVEMKRKMEKHGFSVFGVSNEEFKIEVNVKFFYCEAGNNSAKKILAKLAQDQVKDVLDYIDKSRGWS